MAVNKNISPQAEELLKQKMNKAISPQVEEWLKQEVDKAVSQNSVEFEKTMENSRNLLGKLPQENITQKHIAQAVFIAKDENAEKDFTTFQKIMRPSEIPQKLYETTSADQQISPSKIRAFVAFGIERQNRNIKSEECGQFLAQEKIKKGIYNYIDAIRFINADEIDNQQMKSLLWLGFSDAIRKPQEGRQNFILQQMEEIKAGTEGPLTITGQLSKAERPGINQYEEPGLKGNLEKNAMAEAEIVAANENLADLTELANEEEGQQAQVKTISSRAAKGAVWGVAGVGGGLATLLALSDSESEQALPAIQMSHVMDSVHHVFSVVTHFHFMDLFS